MNFDSKLQSSRVWYFFKKICSIPHPSGYEKKLSDYIADFGRKLGLETIQDDLGNVVIKKPAKRKIERNIILQAHLDMVPQKNIDSEHDFIKHPILIEKNGDIITAKGTTLGADNGIGVAIMMAILENNDILIPSITAIFTVHEEDNQSGAEGLDLQRYVGKNDCMINLDNENDSEMLVGCAGCIGTNISFKVKRENLVSSGKFFKLLIHNLNGGHSGADINLNRANGIKILSRMLYEFGKVFKFNVCDIMGGSKVKNAIPRSAYAIFMVSDCDIELLKETVEKISNEIKFEYRNEEPDMSIDIEQYGLSADSVMKASFQERLINSLHACFDGVSKFMHGNNSMPESSSNISGIEIDDEDNFLIYSLQRSPMDSAKFDVSNRVAAAFSSLEGYSVVNFDPTPGWVSSNDKEICKHMSDVYRSIFGTELRVNVTHGGLECGHFTTKCPDLEIISIGPTIENPHTTEERVYVSSVEKIWIWLLKCLETI